MKCLSLMESCTEISQNLEWLNLFGKSLKLHSRTCWGWYRHCIYRFSEKPMTGTRLRLPRVSTPQKQGTNKHRHEELRHVWPDIAFYCDRKVGQIFSVLESYPSNCTTTDKQLRLWCHCEASYLLCKSMKVHFALVGPGVSCWKHRSCILKGF